MAPRSGPPAQPRDAATVVVLRDGATLGGQGIEVYLVKRSRMVDFMAGAQVFPGGRLDPADASLEACAVRETFEEAGLRLDPAALVPWVRWVTPEVSPPLSMSVVWNDKESGRAYISLPGDPRHPLPDVLGGSIRRFQLEEGRYRAVKAR